MKKYISTRFLEANPITWGDFKEICVDNKNTTTNRKDEQAGYAVKYENSNHLIWVPKEIFETNCKPYDSEADKLNYKLGLLEDYICNLESKSEEDNLSSVKFTIIVYLLKSLETCCEITKELIRITCPNNNHNNNTCSNYKSKNNIKNKRYENGN